MTTWKQRLSRPIAWLRSDEWNYFVLPEVLFLVILVAFAVAAR